MERWSICSQSVCACMCMREREKNVQICIEKAKYTQTAYANVKRVYTSKRK